MSVGGWGLVLFDCDGVLVDSETITARVFAQMLNEMGLVVSIEQIFDRFVGQTMAHCLEIIAGLTGRRPPPAFVQEYHARTKVALTAELQAVPGVVAVLDQLTVPYGVASNGSHEKMQTTLGLTGLLPRFRNRMFSVADVARGKPFPDVYLYAAAHFKVEPAASVVIEDTPTGVTAGVAAGMRVYGYCAHTPRHRLLEAGAYTTFAHMRDLPPLLAATRQPA